MKIPTIACAAILLVCGCVPLNYNATARMHRDKADIKKGILIAGQQMKRFRQVWGDPTKTFSRQFNTGPRANISAFGGSFVGAGRGTYNVWFYQAKEVTLVFHKEELVYWKHGPNPPTEADFRADTMR